MNEIDNSPMMAKDVPTLMNAHEKLRNKVTQLNDLNNLSFILLKKFNRTENGTKPTNETNKQIDTNITVMNIVDLFNDISKELDENINIIGNNLEKVIQMID